MCPLRAMGGEARLRTAWAKDIEAPYWVSSITCCSEAESYPVGTRAMGAAPGGSTPSAEADPW